MMNALEKRVKCVQETFDKFNGVAFELGKNDCARMTCFYLKKMGYKFSLLKGGSYSTEVGARLALKRLGVESVTDILDREFLRLESPASAQIGDIVSTKGDGDTGDALGIVMHRNHILMFLEGVCAEVIVSEFTGAWRVA